MRETGSISLRCVDLGSNLHKPALCSEQDVQSAGNGRASCRLARAVLAASTHTTDAHFVLVADGFELDAVTREIVVRIHKVVWLHVFWSVA